MIASSNHDTGCEFAEGTSNIGCRQPSAVKENLSPQSSDVISKSKLCCNCESTSVEYRCLDCPLEEMMYCQSCSVIHQKVKLTRSHRIVLLNEVEHMKSKVIDNAYRSNSSTGNKRRNVVVSKSGLNEREVSSSNLGKEVAKKKMMKNQQTKSSMSSSLQRKNNLFDVFYERCSNCIDLTDIIEMLTFFEFSVLLDDLPPSAVVIPLIGLLLIVITFSSGDLVTGAGSSVAILVAVTAFLRVMRRRKTMKQNHDPHQQKSLAGGKNIPFRRTSSRTEKGGQFSSERTKV